MAEFVVGLWLVIRFGHRDFESEKGSIMWRLTPLPHLTASLLGSGEDTAFYEEDAAHRAQARTGISGASGRQKLAGKLTAAQGRSGGLRIAEGEAVTVYYEPRAFEDFREMEDAA